MSTLMHIYQKMKKIDGNKQLKTKNLTSVHELQVPNIYN
jgi:hypothetical protein